MHKTPQKMWLFSQHPKTTYKKLLLGRIYLQHLNIWIVKAGQQLAWPIQSSRVQILFKRKSLLGYHICQHYELLKYDFVVESIKKTLCVPYVHMHTLHDFYFYFEGKFWGSNIFNCLFFLLILVCIICVKTDWFNLMSFCKNDFIYH